MFLQRLAQGAREVFPRPSTGETTQSVRIVTRKHGASVLHLKRGGSGMIGHGDLTILTYSDTFCEELVRELKRRDSNALFVLKILSFETSARYLVFHSSRTGDNGK